MTKHVKETYTCDLCQALCPDDKISGLDQFVKDDGPYYNPSPPDKVEWPHVCDECDRMLARMYKDHRESILPK